MVRPYNTGIIAQESLGSNPQAPLRNFGSFVYQFCQCISEETLKSFGPFYVMSIPGRESTISRTGVNVQYMSWTPPILDKDNILKNKPIEKYS